MGLHPEPGTVPAIAGKALAGCVTPPDDLEMLHQAAAKYRAYRHWDVVRLGGAGGPITGQGFNAVKFDLRKPAITIRRMDGNFG